MEFRGASEMSSQQAGNKICERTAQHIHEYLYILGVPFVNSMSGRATGQTLIY